MKRKIIFKSENHKGIGGLQLLVVNLIKENISSNVELDFFAYCRTDCFIRIELESLGHHDRILSEADFGSIKSSDILVVFDYNSSITEFRETGCRLFFWNIIPHNLNVFKSRIPWIRQVFREQAYRFIEELRSNNAVCFMDGAVRKDSEEVVKRSLAYPLIPIPVPKLIESKAEARPGKTEITYLGRCAKWKIVPAKKIWKDLRKVSNGNFQLTIITNSEEHFRKEFGHQPEVKFVEGLKGDTLQSYLRNNSALHIAMGTSALEGAIVGVPTLLIDACHYHLPFNYKYRWLHDENDFTLGHFIKPFDYIRKQDGASLKDVLESIGTPEDWNAMSRRSFEYAKQNHGLEATLRKLNLIVTTLSIIKFIAPSEKLSRDFPKFWALKMQEEKFKTLLRNMFN